MKIRSKIKELIFKPVIDSIDDMDKYEEKEITKKRTFAKKHLVQLLRLVF